jgi:ATP-dependent Clp protease ATP-binding subunit ClpC
MSEKINEELKRMFRPEFLNRVDAIITFKPLTPEQIRMIVELQLVRLAKRLAEQEVNIAVTDAAKDKLGEEGFDKVYGARPLRRVIMTRIEDQLSEELLRGRIARGDTVAIDVDPEGGFTFNPQPGERRKKEEPAEPAPAPSGGAE